MSLAIINAPSNLGLRPPAPTAVPGCCKAPEALREAGLHAQLAARDGYEHGVVLPARYVDDWTPNCGRARNQTGLIDFSKRLAARVEMALDEGASPLVLGGDCSVLMGPALALAQRGRYALVHIDGHSDFRNPNMATTWASVAGEDLAVAVGQHIPELADIYGLGPYFHPSDVVQIGCRDDDEGLPYIETSLARVVPASAWLRNPEEAQSAVIEVVQQAGLEGFWIHLDVDVLDPAFMPAVDSPDPGGVTPDLLVSLLQQLAPHATGAEVCIFDPDLDTGGTLAANLSRWLVDGLGDLGAARH